MKAIFIDVTAQTVTDIDLTPGLDNLYKIIGCDCVDRVVLDSKNDLWLDDSGLLLNPQPPKFQFVGSDNVFAGNGVICGYNQNGETISTIVRAEQIRPFIAFLGDVHVTPPPTIILSWYL